MSEFYNLFRLLWTHRKLGLNRMTFLAFACYITARYSAGLLFGNSRKSTISYRLIYCPRAKAGEDEKVIKHVKRQE